MIDKFKNEDSILETIRAHLRHAKINSSVKKIAFEFTVHLHELTSSKLKLVVDYEYLESKGSQCVTAL